MKKSTRRLTLNKETLGILTDLTGIVGGSDQTEAKSMSMCNSACCPPTYSCPFLC